MVFVLSFAFWEFFTPYNQFGEPFTLIALELVFWAMIGAAESLGHRGRGRTFVTSALSFGGIFT